MPGTCERTCRSGKYEDGGQTPNHMIGLQTIGESLLLGGSCQHIGDFSTSEGRATNCLLSSVPGRADKGQY